MATALAEAPALRETPSSILGVSMSIAQLRGVAIAVVLVAACLTRTVHLATYGFSQDEINKVHAVEEYRHGRFGANAEHPMLMKLAMWGSVALSERWNAVATPERTIAPETAIRLPNALAGAATTLVLFLVVELLFGGAAAIAASALYALDVNAISIARIGKEDTFLLLFFLMAVWCYERGKQRGVTDPSAAQRWYAGSGAAFGLMLASKYMPQYFPIYGLYNTLTDREPGANRPDRRWHFGALAMAFAVANMAIFFPDTWRYCVAYVQGGMLVHHGNPYAGQLYVTNIPISPLGIPATYYLRLIATKVPLAVLGAAFAGGIELIRRRHERGFVLLRLLLLVSPRPVLPDGRQVPSLCAPAIRGDRHSGRYRRRVGGRMVVAERVAAAISARRHRRCGHRGVGCRRGHGAGVRRSVLLAVSERDRRASRTARGHLSGGDVQLRRARSGIRDRSVGRAGGGDPQRRT